MCSEYRLAVQLLEKRGTVESGPLSCGHFGSTKDALYPGESTLADVDRKIHDALARIEPCIHADYPANLLWR